MIYHLVIPIAGQLLDLHQPTNCRFFRDIDATLVFNCCGFQSQSGNPNLRQVQCLFL